MSWRCLRYDGLRCWLRHVGGRWGCGVCGRVGFWLKPGLRFHQRWLCRGVRKEAETWDCLDCGSKNLASICPTKCPVCNGKRTFLTEAKEGQK